MSSVIARPYATDDYDGRLDRMLTPAEQARLKGIASVLSYSTNGLTVYREGQRADALYFIAHGMVETNAHTADGGRQIVAFLHPGDLFGLFENSRYTNTASTLTPAKILQLPLTALKKLLEKDAQLQLHFLVKAAYDLRRSERQLIVLGRRDVQRRLAAFLCDFFRYSDFYDTIEHTLSLPMSRTDIADYLVTTPESVARALASMEKDQLILRVSPKKIRIKNMRSLINLAAR